MDAIKKTEWVGALRSGQYVQTDGALRRPDGFCCLGVFCDLVDSTAWENPEDEGRNFLFHYQGEEDQHQLPDAILEQFQIECEDAEFLADMNDRGDSFAEIANYIEKNM